MTSLKQSYAKTAARNLSFSFILRLLIFELLPSIVPYLNSSQWRANSSTSILRSLSFEYLSMFLALPYFLKIIRPIKFKRVSIKFYFIVVEADHNNYQVISIFARDNDP